MMQDFRQSSEAVGLSQVSKMLRQLIGKISAHYSSYKIINTLLRLFRPDQGPHTVHIMYFVISLHKQGFIRTYIYTLQPLYHTRFIF